MPWLSLKIAADGEHAEGYADALMEAGALSVSTEDRDEGTEREQPQFGEPGLDTPRAWQNNWVVALLPGEADVDAMLVAAGIPLDVERQIETVEEQDWVRLTQSQFDPIRISDRLWIVPSWHDVPDTASIGIVLDPGLAFGTGSHPTTRLCLKWLEANLQGDETLLDYGCGSGILAVAARKLGAAQVVGVDIDPQAVESARFNAENNGVEAQFMLPGGLVAAEFDVVVANILTNPLKALMPLLASHVRLGGRIALSGILEPQAEDVMAIYSEHFEMRLQAAEEGWVCLEGVRRC